jgi:hypothetical protein
VQGTFWVVFGRVKLLAILVQRGEFLFWVVWHEVNSSFHKQINMGERRSVEEYGRKE